MLIIVGIIVTVVVWSNFGPVWGLIVGFLLVGGLGWKLLYGLISAALPGHKDRTEFVNAWEARVRTMEFGNPGTYPPRELYQQWLSDKGTTRESAEAWIEKNLGSSVAQQPWTLGQPAEIRILSGWTFDIGRIDESGQWNDAGDWFAAQRTFYYEIGPAGFTHVDSCGHAHKTREEAVPCYHSLMEAGEPTEDNVRHPSPMTGYVVPLVSVDEEVAGTTTPIAAGLTFGNSLIPWSDVEKVVLPEPGVIIFHIRPGLYTDSPSGEQFPVHVIRVPDLGDAEMAWRDFIGRRGLPTT